MYFKELNEHLDNGGKIRVPNWSDDMYMTRDTDDIAMKAWSKLHSKIPISYYLNISDLTEVDTWEKC